MSDMSRDSRKEAGEAPSSKKGIQTRRFSHHDLIKVTSYSEIPALPDHARSVQTSS